MCVCVSEVFSFTFYEAKLTPVTISFIVVVVERWSRVSAAGHLIPSRKKKEEKKHGSPQRHEQPTEDHLLRRGHQAPCKSNSRWHEDQWWVSFDKKWFTVLVHLVNSLWIFFFFCSTLRNSWVLLLFCYFLVKSKNCVRGFLLPLASVR